MTKVTLSCGFEAEIDEQAVNDMRFLDLLSEYEKGDKEKIFSLKEMSDLLLQPEEKAKLYEALKNEKGRIPIDAFGEAMTELVNQLGSKKK